MAKIGKIITCIGVSFMIFLAVFGCVYLIGATTHNNDGEDYTRDVYIHRIESKYDAAREALATEVDNYIKARGLDGAGMELY